MATGPMESSFGLAIALTLLAGLATGIGGALVLAVVTGIMVFLSLDRLLPNAKRYGWGHESVYGLLVGMLIMALTLAWL